MWQDLKFCSKIFFFLQGNGDWEGGRRRRGRIFLGFFVGSVNFCCSETECLNVGENGRETEVEESPFVVNLIYFEVITKNNSLFGDTSIRTCQFSIF